MNKISREYDFTGEEYCFRVNKKLMSKYKLDDIEKFIIKNEMSSVRDIKVKLQDDLILIIPVRILFFGTSCISYIQRT